MFITLHNLLFRLDENEKLFHNEKRQAYVLFCLARVYTHQEAEFYLWFSSLCKAYCLDVEL